MKVLTFSEVRASPNSVKDDVCSDQTMVMSSLTDFNSMRETTYLLSSARNASRLMESVAQIKAGNAKARELIRHDEPPAASTTMKSEKDA